MSKESLFIKNIWKWLVLLILAVGSVYLVMPPKEKVRLGLDLAGGQVNTGEFFIISTCHDIPPINIFRYL